MNDRSHNSLGEEKISVLMCRYSIPCIISLLVGALYNIVDQIFIANARYLGSNGNAANTVVFPLTVVALGIAVMIGDGACAFVSNCVGAGRKDYAGRTVGNAVVLSVVSGFVLMALYLSFSEQLILAFGGGVNEGTLKCSKEYFLWISIGIPFYIFGQAMNPIIRADGSPKFAMSATLAGAFVNIALDPIFIFVTKWGMAGAAIATVLGQIVTACMSLYYILHTKLFVLDMKCFLPNGYVIGKFISLGLCSFLAQISLVAAMAANNNMIRKYGALDPVFGQPEYAQIPMAVVGIVMKFFQIVMNVVIGMAAGCIPIAGYNIGARQNDRARKLFMMLLTCESVIGFISLLVAEIFPVSLINIFGAANENIYYTEFAKKVFRVYLSMMMLACINKATFIYIQAMGKPVLSSVLSSVREVVFGVGFALLLPVWLGLDGFLLSMPVSEVLTFIISFIAIISVCKELKDGSRQQSIINAIE